MGLFRKKPVVIEAWRFPAEGLKIGEKLIPQFLLANEVMFFTDGKEHYIQAQIKTLEGIMTASLGDWIVKGVAGEFYPVKNEIFGKTYEAVQ
jgi:hypothetical protein